MTFVNGYRPFSPPSADTGRLEFLYGFPRLNAGGLEKLRGYAESGRYRLIIIDVLARTEPPGRRGSDKTYHDIYDMLAPLQEIRHQHPLCLILMTHLRKAEAQDVFDGLHGSVAYQGAQDALWVLERPLKHSIGVVHILGMRGPQQGLHSTYRSQVNTGSWGTTKKMKMSQLRQSIHGLYEETDRLPHGR